ncbi:MAG TPA: hypothetical protein DIC53_05855 [Synergistaceae bacterium]|jgi:DNA-binding MurR/RpiR family transcriptional regulator|nr:hypothetical protein [Synergistaceae bacterium]
MFKERITSRTKEMTASQLRIAEYVLGTPEDAVFLTAKQLAERVGVSEATVIRFARFLGFSGYQEFYTAMTTFLMDRLSTLRRLAEYAAPQGNGLFERAIQKDMDTLARAQAALPSESLKRAGKLLAEAPAVYIAGYRSSHSLAYYLAFYLSWILPNVHILRTDIPFEMLSNAPKGSVVFGISFPRFSTWTVRTLGVAKELGLTTAALTSDGLNPLAADPQYTLSVPYQPISFIDSFAAPMSLLNCIILSVAEALGPKMTEKLETLEKHWKEDGIYEPS